MPSDQRFNDTVGELARLAGGGRAPLTVEPGFPDDDDRGMEAALQRVEDDVRALRGDMTALLVRQGAVEARLGTLEGKVEGLARQIGDMSIMLRSKVIGPWQRLGMVMALLSAAMALPVAIPRLLALIP